jgi:hypothetical protein
MRSLFTLLGLLLVAFLVVGYVRGWYTISKDSSSDPGHSRYEIDLNRGKINQDVKATGERIGDAIHGTSTKSQTK